VSIVRRQDKNEEWKNIKYMVYDAPRAKGNFRQRLKKMEDVLGKLGSKVVVVHPHVECTGS
jgi:DNA ligase-1